MKHHILLSIFLSAFSLFAQDSVDENYTFSSERLDKNISVSEKKQTEF